MSKLRKKYKVYYRLKNTFKDDDLRKKFNSLKWKNFNFSVKKKINCFFHSKNQFLKKSNLYDSFKNNRFKNYYRQNLILKQQLKNFYNLQNYKVKNFVKRELLEKDNFINCFEKRLDVFLYRTKFLKTLLQIRQWINYNNILINRKKQSYISYQLKSGDLLEFKDQPILLKSKINKQQKKVNIYVKQHHLIKDLKYIKIVKKLKIQLKGYKIKMSLNNFNFCPSHIESNYKNLSTIFVNSIHEKKLFNFFLNKNSLIRFYKYNS